MLAFGAVASDNRTMPRNPRSSQGGYCYHVLNRGNARKGEEKGDAVGMALPTVFGIHTFHATLVLSVIGAA